MFTLAFCLFYIYLFRILSYTFLGRRWRKEINFQLCTEQNEKKTFCFAVFSFTSATFSPLQCWHVSDHAKHACRAHFRISPTSTSLILQCNVCTVVTDFFFYFLLLLLFHFVCCFFFIILLNETFLILSLCMKHRTFDNVWPNDCTNW